MALKDLLVYVDQTENSLLRLRLAADLAIRNDSHLTAIFVRDSVEDLVRSPQTDKIAYLVIALDGSFGIDEKNVPVPLEDFKITPNANLLVLDTTKGALAAAPRVNPFTTSGIDLRNQKVDAYWKAHLTN
jgi:nucleotide-binding universal stress UspA family protein